jgi:hypothetical protein
MATAQAQQTPKSNTVPAPATTTTPKVKKKRVSVVPEDETKDAKFKRLATKRVKSILKNITVLGNLGNKNTYGYTDVQIETIFTAIEKATSGAKSKFAKAEEKTKEFHISL